MFRLGMEPTGSKDPFALRRAANSIVKILAETEVALNIDNIITISAGELKDDIAVLSTKTADKMHAFFHERFEFYLRDVKGFTYDVVAAVLAQPNHDYGFNNVRDAIARAEAITAMRGSEDFLAISAAYKRMKNILAQANFDWANPGVTTGPLGELGAMHLALAEKSFTVAGRVKNLREQKKYLSAIEEMATLRPEVDAFFGAVMVNDPDEEIRKRRLMLLAMIVENFSRIADFSEIVTSN
jgi:glycyl-tRNA synthetase beta chain